MTVTSTALVDRTTLTDTAQLLRLLGAAVHACMLGDTERVELLLGQLTPEAARRLATEIDRAIGIGRDPDMLDLVAVGGMLPR